MLLNAKMLERMIKDILAKYVEDYNGFNPDENIDMNLTITYHKANPAEMAKSVDADFDVAKHPDEELNFCYLRISKTLLTSKEKRVIYANYRLQKEFKDDKLMHLSLLEEGLSHLVIGGIEYSEALYLMSMQKEKEKENAETEPEKT